MQVADVVTKAFDFPVNNKKLRAESTSAYVFTLILVLDLVMLTYLITGGVICVRSGRFSVLFSFRCFFQM